jgi:hypothetical protein
MALELGEAMSRSLNSAGAAWRLLCLLGLVLSVLALGMTGSSAATRGHIAAARVLPRTVIGNSACGSVSISPDTQVNGGTPGFNGTDLQISVTWDGSATDANCQMPTNNCPVSSGECNGGYWLVGIFCSTLEYQDAAGNYGDCDLNNAIVMTDSKVGPNNPASGTSYNTCTKVVNVGQTIQNFFGPGLPASPNCAADGSGTGGWAGNWGQGAVSGTVNGPAPQTGGSTPFRPLNPVDCPPSAADMKAGALRNTCAFIVVPVGLGDICSGTTCIPNVKSSNDGFTVLGADAIATTFTYAAPVVAGVTPRLGLIDGGTSVTISGTGFENVNGVYFGGVPATSWTGVSATEVRAVAPRSELPGPEDVEVSTVTAGLSQRTAGDHFTYYPPPGYWMATSDGDVFSAGQAPVLGRTFTAAGDPLVGMASTPDGRGYWVVSSDGTVVGFGDAKVYGTLPDIQVYVNDIVAIAPTADGHGYWLIGRDGGEFAFGDAKFHGSLPGVHVEVNDVVGMVSTDDGGGYWLVGGDGGVFAFGDAHYVGSLPGLNVNVNDVRAMIPSPSRLGYVLVGSDGGTFVFGTGVRFHGSLPGEGIHVDNIVGLALTFDAAGYWLAGADGLAYAFGDGETFAEPSGITDHLPVVALAAT